jgi:hypothetical protein
MEFKEQMPVSARFMGQDTWVGTGISFGDFNFIQTSTKKLFAARRFAVPDWAVNDAMLRKVICEATIQRANGSKHWRASLPKDERERIRLAESLLVSRVPSLEKQIDGLCDEYCALRRTGADPVRQKKLEALISNVDSQLIVNRQPAAIIASIVYLYFRLGLSSVGVAEIIGLSAPAVRQQVYRIWQVADCIGYGGEREHIVRCSSKQAALGATRKNERAMESES